MPALRARSSAVRLPFGSDHWLPSLKAYSSWNADGSSR
ncbi:hypothetical protein Ae505Ps2_2305 [Pseudonocardia sp. Ae505_Ps2]|nr:hypothetical protein Ae505Ps2_2305 [Pseudonocardia sp. Ae505_Ps2]